MSDEFRVRRSWATEPLFYRAPHPEGAEPYAFQHAGVEYHLARDHAMFGDVPGLGKTIEAVLLGNAIAAKRTLVVCPASLRLNWCREVERWSTTPRVQAYPVLTGRDGVSPQADYVVTSYAMLQNWGIMDAILDLRWDHLVLDEAHALKDPRGNRRTRAVCAPDMLPSVCGRITMATGTPMPNQPVEVYNAVRLLCWDAVDRVSLAGFREYYYEEGEGFVTRRGRVEWSNRVRNVPRNLGDLQRRLRAHLMVRRTKDQVLLQLPPRRWKLVPVESDAAVRRALAHPGWAEAERLHELDPDAFECHAPVDGAISTARRLLGEAKVPHAVQYVGDLLEEVDKVVVGAWHLSVLGCLREALSPYGLVYMDGSTSTPRRQAAVDAFQLDPTTRIILGQVGPLGEGWNLSAAQDVVTVEPDWVPGRNDQLLDRPHRPGQEGDYVLGHALVAPGSLDERIVARAIKKDRSIHAALDL